nr:hypothetical protein [Parabacteroides goldsteinii]
MNIKVLTFKDKSPVFTFQKSGLFQRVVTGEKAVTTRLSSGAYRFPMGWVFDVATRTCHRKKHINS